MDHANTALILRDTMAQSCIVRYQWMVCNWFVPISIGYLLIHINECMDLIQSFDVERVNVSMG